MVFFLLVFTGYMFTWDFVYIQVVASGLWLAPGDSEEVAAALSQALRSCIERFFLFSQYLKVNLILMSHLPFYLIEFGRALLGLCYMRFGDVFSKFHQFQSEELFRYVLAIFRFVVI